MTVLLQPRLSSVARKYHSGSPGWGGTRQRTRAEHAPAPDRRTKKVRPGCLQPGRMNTNCSKRTLSYSKIKLSTGIFIKDLAGLVMELAWPSARGSRWSK
ncbi:MAG: hypothetical protein JWR07_2924 [Nevskia sp.]|nr:hypothetical protein [Nevskia sp.]